MFFHRPNKLTPQALTVLRIMERDGGVTHLTAQHYNIPDVCREVNRIRAANPIGYSIRTTSATDFQGRRYTKWVLKSSLPATV